MRARKSTPTNGSEVHTSSPQSLVNLSVQEFRSLTSELIDRIQYASGMAFSSRLDLYKAGGYPTKLTNSHYLDAYERGDVAERLVEAFPKATWTPGASIFENEDPDNVTPWEIAVNSCFDRLDIWNVFKRADILSRLGEQGYSVILIGDKTRIPYERPISKSTSFDSLIYLQPLHQKNVSILEWDEDLFSERYSYPKVYELKLGKSKGRKTATLKVHWSRVIHFTEGGLDNPVFGPPALRSIFNRLWDAEKIFTAGAQAAFKRMDPGVAFSAKNEADLGATDEEIAEAVEEFRKEYEKFRNGLERALVLNNMDAIQLTAPVHNFGANIDSLYKSIAGAKAFPQRKLTGSEEAQLASTQDRSNYQDEIDSRQLLIALPHVRTLVNRVNRDNPEEWDIFWPTRNELNDHEKAELVKTLAMANQAQSLANGEIIHTTNEIRDKVGDGPIEESDQEVDNPTILRGNRFMSSKTPLLDRKHAYCAQKMKARGIVLVNPHDPRFQAKVSDPDEQSAVRRIADKFQPKLERQILDLWSSTIPESDFDNFRLSMDNLERAQDFAIDLYDAMESRMQGEVYDRLLEVMGASGEASLRVVDKRGSWSARRKVGRVEKEVQIEREDDDPRSRSLKVGMKFNHTNPRAIKWAQDRSSALITEISPSTRSAIRSMIADGLREGKSPRLLAREIKDRIGLRSDQLETLNRFALDHTESQVAQRAKRMLRQRAELISRTETLRSSNEGLRETWRQAQDNDLLPDDVQREWIATADDRSRDEHVEVDGEKVGIDEPFSIGVEPGDEPNCRCSQGIA